MESANSQYDVWNLTAQVCEFCEVGEYDKCRCAEDGIVGKIYQALGDLSSDSLDQVSRPALSVYHSFRREPFRINSQENIFLTMNLSMVLLRNGLSRLLLQIGTQSILSSVKKLTIVVIATMTVQ